MAGAVALQPEKLKNNKFSHLDSAYIFVPVAVETCGSFWPQTKAFFKELGHRLRPVTLNEYSHQYLLQKKKFCSSAVGECSFSGGLFALGFQDGGCEKLTTYLLSIDCLTILKYKVCMIDL